MTTENIEQQLTDYVERATKVNKSFINGYGRITKFVRTLKELDIGMIEAVINDSIDGFTKPEISQLDKAYQTASKRNLEVTFGLEWDSDEQRGRFRIPEKREKRSDPFMKAVNAFKKNPDDHGLTVKMLEAVLKKHSKACKGEPTIEIDLSELNKPEIVEAA